MIELNIAMLQKSQCHSHKNGNPDLDSRLGSTKLTTGRGNDSISV